MTYKAVIDTNVIISALLTGNANIRKRIKTFSDGQMIGR